MKFKTKLYLSMFAISTTSIGFALGFMIYDYFQQILLSQSVLATTVAATTAVFLHPEELEQIRTIKDMETPLYRKIQLQLIRAKDVNQRKNVYIAGLYTVRPNPINPQQLVYVVDSEASPSLTGDVGEPLLPVEYGDLLDHIRDFYSTGKIYTDPYGTWITGFAPVFTNEGRYVCSVGADLPASEVLDLRNDFIKSIVYIFIGISTLAFLASFFLVRYGTKSLQALRVALEHIGKGNLEYTATIRSKDEFADLARHINLMTQGLRERDRLKASFAHYVSQHMLHKISTAETAVKLEGERRKVTVLFAKIHEFTHLTESLRPEQTVSMLNEYFESMIEVIFANHGTLDKFIGDGLMVEFGAPVEDDLQERHAIETAIAMQKELAKLNAHWTQVHYPTLQMGIGIHTGHAIMGNIGSIKRMEYTAIGDTVNIAARLQQATKLMNHPLLVSETACASLLGHFNAIDLGLVALPGHEERIHIYAIDPSQ